MGKKGNPGDFEHSTVVGVRRMVGLFHKLLINCDFHAQPSLGLTENGLKQKKHPESGSWVYIYIYIKKSLVDVRPSALFFHYEQFSETTSSLHCR